MRSKQASDSCEFASRSIEVDWRLGFTFVCVYEVKGHVISNGKELNEMLRALRNNFWVWWVQSSPSSACEPRDPPFDLGPLQVNIYHCNTAISVTGRKGNLWPDVLGLVERIRTWLVKPTASNLAKWHQWTNLDLAQWKGRTVLRCTEYTGS